jgi:hypothetical protein
MGLLDLEKFLRPVKDRQGKFLRPDQCLRVAGFTRIADVPSVLTDLQGPREEWPIVLTGDDCYAIMEACWVQWREHGVFPYDTARCPEPHKDHVLPSVVKASMVRKHLPTDTREDLAYLIRLHDGAELEKDVGPRGDPIPAREWDRMLRDIQRSPVETRLCRRTGCNEKVVTTVRAARNSIRVYNLIPEKGQFSGAFFRAHTLCMQHAEARDDRLTAKRSTRDKRPKQKPRQPRDYEKPVTTSLKDKLTPEQLAALQPQPTEEA